MPTASGVVPYGVIQFAGINGNPTSCCSPPKTKFGPRFGIAYQVNSKTTLRAGIGIFYAPFVFGTADSEPGFTQSNAYVASNDGNATPAGSLSNPFPNGIAQPTGNTLGSLTAIGQTFSFLDQKKAGGGTVYQFSADIQRELPKGIALAIGYVGSRSNNLTPSPTGTGTEPINQLNPSYLGLGSALNASVPNPFFGLPGASGVIAASKVTRAQLLLPFPEYSTISANMNPAHAQYDSMTAKVQKRLSHGLTFLSTLTWSRNEDNEYGAGGGNALNGFVGSTPPSFPQNVYNLASEWARSSVDVPIRWTSTWTYALPFGKGRTYLANNKAANYVVGGWSINGTAVVQQGFPLFIFQNNLNTGIGAQAQRPNATGVSPVIAGSPEDRVYGYINPAAFSQAPQYTFGNLSRNIPYRSPGMANWDISIFKDFKVKERFTGQFRAEALNAFNTPLFATPNTQFGGGSFGQLSYQANIPRNLQLGVRLAW